MSTEISVLSVCFLLKKICGYHCYFMWLFFISVLARVQLQTWWVTVQIKQSWIRSLLTWSVWSTRIGKGLFFIYHLIVITLNYNYICWPAFRYQFPPMNPLWHGLLGFVIAVLGFISIVGNGMVIYIFTATKVSLIKIKFQ